MNTRRLSEFVQGDRAMCKGERNDGSWALMHLTEDELSEQLDGWHSGSCAHSEIELGDCRHCEDWAPHMWQRRRQIVICERGALAHSINSTWTTFYKREQGYSLKAERA